MTTFADPGNRPSTEIGAHGVIRHAYENVLTACARLASFATSNPITTDGPIEDQQEILAVDDLATYAGLAVTGLSPIPPNKRSDMAQRREGDDLPVEIDGLAAQQRTDELDRLADLASMSRGDFRISYFALAKRYHPDRNPCGAELMANINAARAAILNSYRKSAA